MAFLKTLGAVIVMALWYAVFYLAIGVIGFGIVYIIAALVDTVFDTDARGAIARLRTSIFGTANAEDTDAPTTPSTVSQGVQAAHAAARHNQETDGPVFINLEDTPETKVEAPVPA